MEPLQLQAGPGGLELRTPSERPGQGVRATPFAVLSRGLDGHPLARILRNLQGPFVDATAGLGTDAGIAAAMGMDALLLEANPLVHQLLKDALERAEGPREEALAQRMHLVHGDACQLLEDLPEPFSEPVAVLLDPMFPARRRQSALPPKAMQRLRTLTGEDTPESITQLLEAAGKSAARRIILKRPPEASIEHAALGKVTFSLETKLLRWDVWERG